MRWVFLVFVLSVPAWAAKDKLAVLDPGGDPKLARAVEEQLLDELHRGGRYEVIGSSDLVVMLGVERQKELLSCGDQASDCIAEIMGALGAPWVLASSVVPVGSQLRLDLKLIDVKQNKVVARAGRVVSSEDELFTSFSAAVRELFADLGGARRPSSGGWFKWALGGAGLAAAGVGVGLMAAGSSGAAGLEAQKANTAWLSLSRQLNGLQTEYWTGVGLLSAGVLLVITSAVMLWLTRDE